LGVLTLKAYEKGGNHLEAYSEKPQDDLSKACVRLGSQYLHTKKKYIK